MSIENYRMRERDLVLNESAGDITITKAVVLIPGYNPSSVDFKKVLSYDIHAIYNSYTWNRPTRQLSKGVLLSHSDIVDRSHIDSGKIMGYFVKEGNEILEYELIRPIASKFLTGNQILQIESELKKLKW